MPCIHVFSGLGTTSDKGVAEIALSVANGLNGNVAYPSPPVAITELLTVRTVLLKAIEAEAQGKRRAKARKKQARSELVQILIRIFRYVEDACNQDAGIPASATVARTRTNRNPAQRLTPQILAVLDGRG